MSKTLQLAIKTAIFVTPAVAGQHRVLNDLVTDLFVNDDVSYEEFEIAAGGTAEISKNVFKTNQELFIVPFFIASGDAGYGKFTVKVTHAAGDSTFAFRSMGAFIVLSTDTGILVTNSDGSNILKIRVTYYRQTT